MSTNPRRHHIIPKFFLANFTLSGRKGDRLWVIDTAEKRIWQSTPERAGHQRDFYRVNVESIDPALVERALGIVEGDAAPILKEMIDTKNLPTSDELSIMILFATTMAMRGPTFRRTYENFKRQTTKSIAMQITGSREVFGAIKQDLESKGEALPEEFTYERAHDFIRDESRYSIEVPTTASVMQMLELVPEIYPHFAARHWTLFVANEDARDFITSDRPVGLVSRNPEVPFTGLGAAFSDIVMPLSRRIALFGHIHGGANVAEATDLFVASTNALLELQCERFLFAATDPRIPYFRKHNT